MLAAAGYCREPAGQGGQTGALEALRGEVAVGAGIRGTLPLCFPALRWFGNECLNAATLNPFPALSQIYGMWSCKLQLVFWRLSQHQQCSGLTSRAPVKAGGF